MIQQMFVKFLKDVNSKPLSDFIFEGLVGMIARAVSDFDLSVFSIQSRESAKYDIYIVILLADLSGRLMH